MAQYIIMTSPGGDEPVVLPNYSDAPPSERQRGDARVQQLLDQGYSYELVDETDPRVIGYGMAGTIISNEGGPLDDDDDDDSDAVYRRATGGGGSSGGGGSIPPFTTGPAQVARSWLANGVPYTKLTDGSVWSYSKRRGTWKRRRKTRAVVLTSKSDMSTIAAAERMLDRQAKAIAKRLRKRGLLPTVTRTVHGKDCRCSRCG